MRHIPNIIIRNKNTIKQRILRFYTNAKKFNYPHSYGWDEVKQDAKNALEDKDLTYGNSTKQEWLDNGYDVVTNKRGWAFAFKMEDKDTMVVYDVDNCDNLPLLYQNRNQVYHKPNNVINMTHGIFAKRESDGLFHLYTKNGRAIRDAVYEDIVQKFNSDKNGSYAITVKDGKQCKVMLFDLLCKLVEQKIKRIVKQVINELFKREHRKGRLIG